MQFVGDAVRHRRAYSKSLCFHCRNTAAAFPFPALSFSAATYIHTVNRNTFSGTGTPTKRTQRTPTTQPNQIGDAIARPADDLFDDDALLEELDMLEEADLEEQLLAPPAVPTARPSAPQAVQQPSAAESKVDVPAGYDLPSVPSSTPVSAPVAVEEDEDARALRELEASMAM